MKNRPDSARSRRAHETPTCLRVIVALLGGFVAPAPFGLCSLAGWAPGINQMVLALTLSLAAGAFIVSSIVTDKPRWLPGAGFGSAVWFVVVGAILFFGVHAQGNEVTFSPIAGILLLAAAAGAFVGAIGGLMGELTGLALTEEGVASRSRLKPWHLGVAVLVIDVMAYEVIALTA